MNRTERVDVIVFSSLSFNELKVGDDTYEMHEIDIHRFLNMENISSSGRVGFARLAKSDEYDVAYQPIERNLKYVATVTADARGLLFTLYDDSSPILEATTENIERFNQYVELHDSLSLGLVST